MGNKRNKPDETARERIAPQELARDRRALPRYRVRYLSAVTPSLHGDVLNISENGLSIETVQAVVIGRSYALGLEDLVNEVSIQATVRWCLLHRNMRILSGDVVPVYRAGLSFDNQPSNELWSLLRAIEEHNRLDERR